MKIKNSIVLSQIEDNGYYIKSSVEEVIRFQEKVNETEVPKGENYVFSPGSLWFEVYSKPSMLPNEKISLTVENCRVEILSESGNTQNFVTDDNQPLLFYEFEEEYLETGDTEVIDDKEYYIFTGKVYELQSNLQNFETGIVYYEKNLEFVENRLIVNLDILRLQDYLLSGLYIINFSYGLENNRLASKSISLRNGVSDEMAKFNITATAINSAIKGTSMTFTEQGLTLKDGYFKIVDENNNTVFGLDENNLMFRGRIEATDGVFNGTVNATEATFQSGTIGGFVISQDKLVSIKQGIELNGAEGKIIADNLILGTGAEISQYIQVGRAKISKPTDENGNTFINCEATKITDDGIAYFGDITIDGINSEISGASFSITPSMASFSNVSIEGTIETAVFKTGTTQAAGSAMIFMPSYKIEKINGINITLDQDIREALSAGILVWLVENNNYKPYKIKEILEEDNKVSLEGPNGEEITEIDNATALIIVGNIEDTTKAPLIFGINGGNVNVAKENASDKGYVLKRGLTINEYGNNGLPKLFLGDLSSLGSGYDGYGLYSDNVYLKGSLTTELANGSYAGINTLSNKTATKFGTDDISNIVFWAGATLNNNEPNVQDALFQVTENGSVYAARAKLADSLIVGTTIKSAELYAARIYGDNEDNNEPGLTIYNTTKGISFKSITEESGQSIEKETFSIGENSFKIGEKNFIEISSSATFIGETKTEGSNYIILESAKESVGPRLYHYHTKGSSCGFTFNHEETTYTINPKEAEAIEKIIWSIEDTKILGTVTFAENSAEPLLQYKPAIKNDKQVGYDLFIIGE